MPTAPGDYTALNDVQGLLTGTGNPGNTVFCSTVMIQNDNIAEGIEDFTVQLSSLSPGFIVVNQPSVATVQILDNDCKPTHKIAGNLQNSLYSGLGDQTISY